MDETCKAFKGMGFLNALGSDGSPPLFFKRIWETTGRALHHFAQGILRVDDIPLEAPEAPLVLISEEESQAPLGDSDQQVYVMYI